MQGKKDYQEKQSVSFQLSEHIPKHNFYGRLKGALDLDLDLQQKSGQLDKGHAATF